MRLLCGYAAQSMSEKAKALGRGFNPAEGLLHSRAFGGSLDESPEPVVHAGAEDMVAQVVEGDVRVKSDWAAGPNGEAFLGRVKVAEVDIEVLGLHRPAVAERL